MSPVLQGEVAVQINGSWQGLADIARHVIQRIFNPCFLSLTATYDVANPTYVTFLPITHFEPSSLELDGIV